MVATFSREEEYFENSVFETNWSIGLIVSLNSKGPNLFSRK